MVTFEPVDGGSRVCVTERCYTKAEARDLSAAGMVQCLDKLEQLLAVDDDSTGSSG